MAAIRANASRTCATWNQKQKLRSAALRQSEPVKYSEIIADRLHAEGWSYPIAEHFTKRDLFFASMRTAMENDSLLRPMIC